MKKLIIIILLITALFCIVGCRVNEKKEINNNDSITVRQLTFFVPDNVNLITIKVIDNEPMIFKTSDYRFEFQDEFCGTSIKIFLINRNSEEVFMYSLATIQYIKFE